MCSKFFWALDLRPRQPESDRVAQRSFRPLAVGLDFAEVRTHRPVPQSIAKEETTILSTEHPSFDPKCPAGLKCLVEGQLTSRYAYALAEDYLGLPHDNLSHMILI